MSANITWTPMNKGGNIKTSIPSAFIKSIENTFGKFPIKLNTNDLDILQGMFNASKEHSYEQIIELIEKYDEVFIEAYY